MLSGARGCAPQHRDGGGGLPAELECGGGLPAEVRGLGASVATALGCAEQLLNDALDTVPRCALHFGYSLALGQCARGHSSAWLGIMES